MSIYGEIAAICAAIVWALATWIYGQFSHQFSAMQLNIIKGVVASCMMLIVMPIIPTGTLEISTHHALILGISGIVGIAIGDSAYFAALKRIGPNHTLLLESLAPPLSGLIALLALGTALSLGSWFGVLLTTVSVAFVLFKADGSQQPLSRSGIGFGVLASVCQASGVVISHFALVAGDVNPLLGALIRLSVGVLAVAITINMVEASPWTTMRKLLKDMRSKQWLILLGAIFVGTFIALWLQQIALKYANPAVAQTLIATSPLFMLIIYKFKGEPLSTRALLGTLGAVAGVGIIFLT
ncbi:DMT family transporter [Vibrio gallicus]|uniref:DMT family transporter n=1 Tax=Vibrio gallicus TaxID=190897 RepID=UPI0021C3A929|nr:DMT family transporter [Vibrio gallicus]